MGSPFCPGTPLQIIHCFPCSRHSAISLEHRSLPSIVLQLVRTVFCNHRQLGVSKAAICDGAGKPLNTRAGIARTTTFVAWPVSFSVCRPADKNRMTSTVADPLATANGRSAVSSVRAASPAKAKKHQPLRGLTNASSGLPSSPRLLASISSLTRLLRTSIRHGSAGNEAAFSSPMALVTADARRIVKTRNNCRRAGHELASGGGSAHELG